MVEPARAKWAEKWGLLCPFPWEGEAGSPQHLSPGPRHTSTLRTKWSDPSGHLATTDMGRGLYGRKKWVRLLCPFPWGEWRAMSPSNSVAWAEAYLHTKWHLIHATIWPQYTNVTVRQTDGQTGHQPNSIRQTIFGDRF